MKRSFLGLALVLGLLASVPLAAHHSFSAEFDAAKPVTLKGWVTKIDWTNPHVWIYMNVKDEKSGAMTNWGFEMGPPHLLQGQGWTRNSLKIGDEVMVEGSMTRCSRLLRFFFPPNIVALQNVVDCEAAVKIKMCRLPGRWYKYAP